jgi:hypothetical protein
MLVEHVIDAAKQCNDTTEYLAECLTGHAIPSASQHALEHDA